MVTPSISMPLRTGRSKFRVLPPHIKIMAFRTMRDRPIDMITRLTRSAFFLRMGFQTKKSRSTPSAPAIATAMKNDNIILRPRATFSTKAMYAPSAMKSAWEKLAKFRTPYTIVRPMAARAMMLPRTIPLTISCSMVLLSFIRVLYSVQMLGLWILISFQLY